MKQSITKYMDYLPKVSHLSTRAEFSLVIFTYLASAFITYSIAVPNLLDQFTLQEYPEAIIYFSLGLPFLIILYFSHKRGIQSIFWWLAWIFLYLCVALNIVFRVIDFHTYGDQGFFAPQITHGNVVARWLGGSALANLVYEAVWRFPLLLALIPDRLSGSDSFVKVVGALVMVVGTLILLHYRQNRFIVLIPITLPIWIMFSIGYDEYYPFITSLFAFSLIWIFHSPLEKRKPLHVALLATSLTIFYIGFAPLSILILLFYIASRPSKALETMGFAVIIMVIMIAIFWDGSVSSFFGNLYQQLDLGERNTVFARYVGKSAYGFVPFFSIAYAFSFEHLSDIGQMYFWGGGWVVPVWLVVSVIFTLSAYRNNYQQIIKELRVWLGVAIFAWQIYYILFMIPKLGPQQDIDLFFTVYISVAFFAGLLTDLRIQKASKQTHTGYILLAAIIGNTVVASTFLLVYGLT